MNADAITGERVHIALRRRGIAQEQLAEVLGLTQTSTSRKLLGRRSWSLDEVLATAQFLDVPVTDLLPGDDYAPVPAGRGRVGVGVRSKGLEPPTFCLGVSARTLDAGFWSASRKSALLALEGQLTVDGESADRRAVL